MITSSNYGARDDRPNLQDQLQKMVNDQIIKQSLRSESEIHWNGMSLFHALIFFITLDPTYRLDEGCWDRKDTSYSYLIKSFPSLMRLLLLTQKKNVLKVHVMVNKYMKVGWLGATTIHQMKFSRLYTQYMPLQQNKKTHYCIIVWQKAQALM